MESETVWEYNTRGRPSVKVMPECKCKPLYHSPIHRCVDYLIRTRRISAPLYFLLSKFRINKFFEEILVTFIVPQVDVRYYDDHHIRDRSESNIVIYVTRLYSLSHLSIMYVVTIFCTLQFVTFSNTTVNTLVINISQMFIAIKNITIRRPL